MAPSRIVIAASLLIVAGPLLRRQAFGQYTQADLRDFAARAIDDGTVAADPPRFEVRRGGSGEKVFNYFLGAASIADPAHANDPFKRVLTQQFRVALIRKYRNAPAQRRFWQPTLEAVESEITRMLAAVQDDDLNEEQLSRRLAAHEERISNLYQEAIERAAEIEGATRIQGPPRFAAGTVGVNLSARPAARLFYIAAGWWDLYQLALARNRRVRWERKWAEVAQGERIYLSGKYYFKVHWTDEAPQVFGPIQIRSRAYEFTPEGPQVVDDE